MGDCWGGALSRYKRELTAFKPDVSELELIRSRAQYQQSAPMLSLQFNSGIESGKRLLEMTSITNMVDKSNARGESSQKVFRSAFQKRGWADTEGLGRLRCASHSSRCLQILPGKICGRWRDEGSCLGQFSPSPGCIRQTGHFLHTHACSYHYFLPAHMSLHLAVADAVVLSSVS